MGKVTRVLLLVMIILFASNHQTFAAHQSDRSYYEEKGDVVWEVKTKHQMVALTFDDGPDIRYTNTILDLLAEHNASATFFVVGNRVEEAPEVAKRIIKEGNEIANHTNTHPNLSTLSQSELDKEIKDAEQAIFNVTGARPNLFRPPLGLYNDEIVHNIRENDYIAVMWSWHQDTYDWRNPGVEAIVNKVLKNITNGDIILFHDYGGDRSQTVKALAIILPELQKKGYQFVTVSELLKEDKKFQVPLMEIQEKNERK
ncbi:polysaccharide deacetylase family protein [Alkalihalophilus marmarensis]|uniref:polysaccharide deacetylase family protein n=1 Tax=Alkalihalophilus marmarensis TaxID=521377 RepID=UPI00203FDC21|nr:polysaccharide deacetylase family protein [Alkalihalophilus marmarensis]MCM3490594.1 polysaccharide deacetylase family protein [Alkalihalophilus marmarensis]